jgi:hypothetical protein
MSTVRFVPIGTLIDAKPDLPADTEYEPVGTVNENVPSAFVRATGDPAMEGTRAMRTLARASPVESSTTRPSIVTGSVEIGRSGICVHNANALKIEARTAERVMSAAFESA